MTAAESVNEEAVELLAQALSSPSRSWIWGHVSHEGEREWWRGEARELFADLLPLLRPSDVPHLERRIRESIAGEIALTEAERAVLTELVAYGFRSQQMPAASIIAKIDGIARGSSS